MSISINFTASYLLPQSGGTSDDLRPGVAAGNARFEGGYGVGVRRLRHGLVDGIMQSSLRIARTRAIRTEIENGTYETPERIDATARRLLDVIG